MPVGKVLSVNVRTRPCGAGFRSNSSVGHEAVCVASAAVVSFLLQIGSICAWKGSVRRGHVHVYPIFTGSQYSVHDASRVHLMSLFLLSMNYPE